MRGQRGQIDAANTYRHLLGSRSEVSESHKNCDKVQDPYSLRCQPQVMGACLTQMRQAAEVLAIESNAVSDNPLVFADQGDVLSGGISMLSRWLWRRIIWRWHWLKSVH